jgi:hypothetical protein
MESISYRGLLVIPVSSNDTPSKDSRFTILEWLPLELILLPMDLARLGRVSKQWRELSIGPNVWKQYVKKEEYQKLVDSGSSFIQCPSAIEEKFLPKSILCYLALKTAIAKDTAPSIHARK